MRIAFSWEPLRMAASDPALPEQLMLVEPSLVRVVEPEMAKVAGRPSSGVMLNNEAIWPLPEAKQRPFEVPWVVAIATKPFKMYWPPGRFREKKGALHSVRRYRRN